MQVSECEEGISCAQVFRVQKIMLINRHTSNDFDFKIYYKDEQKKKIPIIICLYLN